MFFCNKLSCSCLDASKHHHCHVFILSIRGTERLAEHRFICSDDIVCPILLHCHCWQSLMVSLGFLWKCSDLWLDSSPSVRRECSERGTVISDNQHRKSGCRAARVRPNELQIRQSTELFGRSRSAVPMACMVRNIGVSYTHTGRCTLPRPMYMTATVVH